MEMEGTDMEKHTPWLLISHGDQYSKQSFYSTLDDRLYATSIPELCNKEIIPCAYGWLVLMDIETDDCCLWNPVSMKTIELPQLEDCDMYNKCVLSKLPTDPDCHILFNSACGYHQAFCRLGDHEFVIQSLSEEEGLSLMAVGSFQDKIYGLVRDGFRFVTAHFVGKTLQLRPILMAEEGDKERQGWRMPNPSPMWAKSTDDFLIEFPCGELFLVHQMLLSSRGVDSMDFRIFWVDTLRMKCVELEDIGNRTIFLSNSGGGFCCVSEGGLKPNSIYYVVPDSRNLYIFDLDDRSTTLLLPCPAARRSQSVSYWVEYPTFEKLRDNFT